MSSHRTFLSFFVFRHGEGLVKTAILVDGAFFIKRYKKLISKDLEADKVARAVVAASWRLIRKANKADYRQRKLYRIFFYDCASAKYYAGPHPVTGKPYKIEEYGDYAFRDELHKQLVGLRKVALRLGELHPKSGKWAISPSGLKKLKEGSKLDELEPEEVYYEVKQAGVDMRIGLDIASLSAAGDIDQIVLIAGDSDFVPAAKMARRNGIDFVLDPEWHTIRPELKEHIDGLCSVFPKPGAGQKEIDGWLDPKQGNGQKKQKGK
jgi:uncharacterized LabA/DUF88 family protein